MNKTLILDLELREIYYNPVTGYQSAEKLYKKAVEKNVSGVTRKLVQEWLTEQSTYTLHKPLRKPKKTSRTFVKNLADQIQMDLVDMSKFNTENRRMNWILTGIEILSRFAFAVPVHRKNTESMVTGVGLMLTEFKDHFKKYPEVVQFDNGNEFYNVGVKTLLKSHGVEYFSTHSERKAAIVERFNRTLKTRMWKYFTYRKTKTWYDVLPKFVKSYNNTFHRTIKMKPKEVNKKNQDAVFLTLYGIPPSVFPKPKFQVNDNVRIYKYKKNFAKGYDPNFTNEIFKITAVFRGNPVMYKIADHKSENILGKFYESELVLTTEDLEDSESEPESDGETTGDEPETDDESTGDETD